MEVRSTIASKLRKLNSGGRLSVRHARATLFLASLLESSVQERSLAVLQIEKGVPCWAISPTLSDLQVKITNHFNSRSIPLNFWRYGFKNHQKIIDIEFELKHLYQIAGFVRKWCYEPCVESGPMLATTFIPSPLISSSGWWTGTYCEHVTVLTTTELDRLCFFFSFLPIPRQITRHFKVYQHGGQLQRHDETGDSVPRRRKNF